MLCGQVIVRLCPAMLKHLWHVHVAQMWFTPRFLSLAYNYIAVLSIAADES